MEVHDERIVARIARLTGMTLDETFVELGESQQYFYPGFYTEVQGVPKNIQKLLSTRTFLKILQDFDALPREEAVAKLYEFSEVALDAWYVSSEMILVDARRRHEDPTTELPPRDRSESIYMLCTSLLLAARMGEHELLIRQIDEMQSRWNTFADEMMGYFEPPFADMAEELMRGKLYGPLEDDAILTVFMHALAESGDVNALDLTTFLIEHRVFQDGAPFAKGIPLYRWDTPLTCYDFAVQLRGQSPDPNDLAEVFYNYEFPKGYDKQTKETVLNTLK